MSCAAVEIAPGLRAEGMVTELRRGPDGVLVELLLADGSCASAELGELDADWLELRVGDIVGVRPVSG
jgi:hypothetical protein